MESEMVEVVGPAGRIVIEKTLLSNYKASGYVEAESTEVLNTATEANDTDNDDIEQEE